jgi:hypothetical protein
MEKSCNIAICEENTNNSSEKTNNVTTNKNQIKTETIEINSPCLDFGFGDGGI